MRFVESETCELKQRYTPQIIKEVVAFLNGRGGTIYIGVDDEGLPVGVGDSDQEALRVSNAIRDAIKPDAVPFVSCTPYMVDGVTLLALQVNEGSRKPYYIASKGLRPEGNGASVSPLPASRAEAGRPCARNAAQRNGARSEGGERRTHCAVASFGHDEIERTVRFIELHGAVTRKEIQEFLGVGQTKAGVMLRELVASGVICQVGSGPATRYRAA